MVIKFRRKKNRDTVIHIFFSEMPKKITNAKEIKTQSENKQILNEKLLKRRERNKLVAARSRERRQKLYADLLERVKELEIINQNLQRDKADLETLLNSHSTHCTHRYSPNFLLNSGLEYTSTDTLNRN